MTRYSAQLVYFTNYNSNKLNVGEVYSSTVLQEHDELCLGCQPVVGQWQRLCLTLKCCDDQSGVLLLCYLGQVLANIYGIIPYLLAILYMTRYSPQLVYFTNYNSNKLNVGEVYSSTVLQEHKELGFRCQPVLGQWQRLYLTLKCCDDQSSVLLLCYLGQVLADI
jgi:hypothetical protein